MEHTVTYENTVKHWVLYTLDAWEKKHDDEDPRGREVGARAEDLHEFAGAEDSIIFRNSNEVSSMLSQMFRDKDDVVQRRSDATEFLGPDVRFDYRLGKHGRNVLLDLGTPTRLPNRQDLDEEERDLTVKPAHQPGWWRDDWDLSDERFEDPDDWTATDHDRIWYRSPEDKFSRGELNLVEDIAEAFPECSFVITMGPWRMHDIAYAIRDPFEKVIQIDIYSAGLIWGDRDWERNVQDLTQDLHKGLEAESAGA